MLTFDPKDPAEIITLGMNFKNLLGAGETISACTVTITDSAGGDTTSSMVQGAADISATPLIRQMVKGGNDGETYVFQATVQTSEGQTLVGQAKLPVHQSS